MRRNPRSMSGSSCSRTTRAGRLMPSADHCATSLNRSKASTGIGRRIRQAPSFWCGRRTRRQCKKRGRDVEGRLRLFGNRLPAAPKYAVRAIAGRSRPPLVAASHERSDGRAFRHIARAVGRPYAPSHPKTGNRSSHFSVRWFMDSPAAPDHFQAFWTATAPIFAKDTP